MKRFQKGFRPGFWTVWTIGRRDTRTSDRRLCDSQPAIAVATQTHGTLGSLSNQLISKEPSMRRVKRTSSCLLVVACLFFVLAWCWRVDGQTRTTGVTVFEGARLITGDGGAPIENSAFIVENNLFTRVGRRGDLRVPAGAVHVDLKGKTVI